MAWNQVVTIDDFYDRPRSGIAFYGERLVSYKTLWNEEIDDYSSLYGVTPIDVNLLPLIEEYWEIWKRWDAAFHDGEASRESHPALPDDRARYEELSVLLKFHTEVDQENCLKVEAEFRSARPGWDGIEVCWHLARSD